jgi:hypothetical protein
LEVPDDRHPQVEDDPLAGVGHDILPHAIDDRADQEDDDEPGDEHVEQSRILEPVDNALHDLGPVEAEDRRDDQQDRGEDDVPPVRRDEVEQAPIHRQRRALPWLIAARSHEHEVPAATARAHDHHPSIMRPEAAYRRGMWRTLRPPVMPDDGDIASAANALSTLQRTTRRRSVVG